jgi:hypothetical protein
MSKVFYDHLVSLDDVEKALKKRKLSVEEREELWKIIDEMVHHRVVGCILEHLPSEHHGDFVKLVILFKVYTILQILGSILLEMD